LRLERRRRGKISFAKERRRDSRVFGSGGEARTAVMAWSKSTRIIIMLVIDVMFFALELGVGLTVGSLALMADAFHMVGSLLILD
jgi:Co/Zn/Cd efflux system component